jgi:hypothetical protein
MSFWENSFNGYPLYNSFWMQQGLLSCPIYENYTYKDFSEYKEMLYNFQKMLLQGRIKPYTFYFTPDYCNLYRKLFNQCFLTAKFLLDPRSFESNSRYGYYDPRVQASTVELSKKFIVNLGKGEEGFNKAYGELLEVLRHEGNHADQDLAAQENHYFSVFKKYKDSQRDWRDFPDLIKQHKDYLAQFLEVDAFARTAVEEILTYTQSFKTILKDIQDDDLVFENSQTYNTYYDLFKDIHREYKSTSDLKVWNRFLWQMAEYALQIYNVEVKDNEKARDKNSKENWGSV